MQVLLIAYLLNKLYLWLEGPTGHCLGAALSMAGGVVEHPGVQDEGPAQGGHGDMGAGNTAGGLGRSTGTTNTIMCGNL